MKDFSNSVGIDKIRRTHNALDLFENRLNELKEDASRQHAQQQLETITNELVSSLMRFQNLSYLGKLSLYRTLDKLIDVWDRSIKAYKDNPACTPKQYYQAVQRFHQCVVQPILSSSNGVVNAQVYQDWQKFVNIPQLLRQVHQGQDNDKRTMEPSIDFDVSALLASRHVSSTGRVLVEYMRII